MLFIAEADFLEAGSARRRSCGEALHITARTRHKFPRRGTIPCSCSERRPAHEGQILLVRAAGEGKFLTCGRSYVQSIPWPAFFKRSKALPQDRGDVKWAGMAAAWQEL